MKRTLENAIITEETVKDLGEKIAMMAVRKLAALSNGLLDNLYKGLICDYLHRDEFGYVYSNGYDVASNAMLFLWQYKGKSLARLSTITERKLQYSTLALDCSIVTSTITEMKSAETSK